MDDGVAVAHAVRCHRAVAVKEDHSFVIWHIACGQCLFGTADLLTRQVPDGRPRVILVYRDAPADEAVRLRIRQVRCHITHLERDRIREVHAHIVLVIVGADARGGLL